MKMNEIIEYLEDLIPNAVCELNYNKDYELLIAVMLSAQTTDKKVNMVTSVLFEKYPSLEALRDSDINDIIEIIRPIGTFNKKALNIKSIAHERILKCIKLLRRLLMKMIMIMKIKQEIILVVVMMYLAPHPQRIKIKRKIIFM